MTVEEDHHSIGIGNLSPEASTSVNYLFRGGPGSGTPRPLSTAPGCYGWGVPTFVDHNPANTGSQLTVVLHWGFVKLKYRACLVES